MQRLFIIGALIGLGFGLFKFMKKNEKGEMNETVTPEPMPA